MRLYKTPKYFNFIFPGIWRIPSKSIYLTFDDGPDPEITPWVLSILEKHNIKATFFCVGENVKKHFPIIEKIVARGHTIGNHTYSHERGRKTDNNLYMESVMKTSLLIKTPFFRPPYGSIKRSQIKSLKENGYRIVFWSWLSHDYDTSLSPKKIISKSKKIRSGDILVFHDSKKAEKNLKNSLEEIIVYLSQKGFQFGVLTT